MSSIIFYLLISVLLNFFLFLPAYKFKTDKLTDLSYSLSFIVLIIATLIQNQIGLYKLLLASMVIVWALRLGGFLFIRIKKMKRDKRFDGIREYFFKFLQFWLMQALVVWIILIPALLFLSQNQIKLFWGGFFIWLLGFLIESIADYQKFKFKQNFKNKDQFIQTGLWQYSRHPNYFGEILCWIGIYLFVLTSFSPLIMIISFISPLFITLLLVFVTGLPPLEKYGDKKWGKNKNYKEYKRKTSILVPWFRKK
jgi:steroid 5-alpha reductase family enzyme